MNVTSNSEVQQLRDIAARFERAARHCFTSKVQRFRDSVERFEWVRLYSIRRRRTARIERFTKTQRDKREWINFAEIAEHCSEENGVVPNEVARETAYEKLLAYLLEGDFEKNGVSQIMYLHPYTSKTRMTREWLIGLLEFKDADRATIISQYLAHCWMPRVFLERWLAKHRMEPRPQRFEPTEGKHVTQSSGKSGPPPPPATRQPQQERARRALRALFDSEVPDAATLPNKHLADKVNKWLKDHDQPPVGQRTIRRAAGRK